MRFILILLVSFCALSNRAQVTISAIEARVAIIQKAKSSFDSLTINYPEDGSRTSYYELLKPRIVSVLVPGKIEKKVTWYFYEERLMYTETNWCDSLTKKVLYNDKTYHNEKGLFAWIDTNNNFVDGNSAVFKKLDKQLSEYGHKIYDRAKEDREQSEH